MNGQAKIDFEKWLFENYNDLLYSMCGSKTLLKDLLLADHIKNTDKLLNSVIIEFFDSVGITVDIIPRIIDNKVFFEPNTFCLNPEIITEDFEKFKTRQEATEKAIEKAVEIYNNLK